MPHAKAALPELCVCVLLKTYFAVIHQLESRNAGSLGGTPLALPFRPAKQGKKRKERSLL